MVSVGNVMHEIAEHDSPGGGVLPDAGSQAYMLAVVGHPHSQEFE